MTEPSMWMMIGFFWFVILALELIVVLIWVRNRARLLTAGGLAVMLVHHVVLPQVLPAGHAASSLVMQLFTLTGLVLIGLGVIASRPLEPRS